MAIFFTKFLYILMCIILSIGPFLLQGEMVLFLTVISLYMLLFFLLPVIQRKDLFLILQVILITILLFSTSIIFSPLILLYFYIVLEGSSVLRGRKYLLFLIVMGTISVIPFILGEITAMVTYLLCYGLIASICYIRSTNYEDKNTYKEMYQKLLSEYRKLKRMTNDERELARIEERNRIARDIHDSVGHQLTSLIMQLEMSKLIILNHEEAVKSLDSAKEIASTSLKETRNAVKALKNDSINGIEAVIQLIKKLEADSHLQVHLTTRNGILNSRLSNELSIVLYRTIQECLTNVMRHGQTKQVNIILELVAERSVRATVENPLHQENSYYEGFGLKSLRERVEQIGGQVSIGIVQNLFQVSVLMPLTEREQ